MKPIHLRSFDGQSTSIGISSVPVLPGYAELVSSDAKLQTVPVGFWPTRYLDLPQFTSLWARHGWRKPSSLGAGRAWPRRLLTFMEFSKPCPPEIALECTSSREGAVRGAASTRSVEGASEWSVRVVERPDVRKRNDHAWHYCADEGGVDLAFEGKTCRLRFAFERPERQAVWQWVHAQRLWSGPIAEAWQIGGTIYAGKNDRPLTPEEAARWFESEFASEQMIMVKVFAILLKNGCADLRAHWINGELYGHGGFVAGKPLLIFEAPDGIATQDTEAGAWRVRSEDMAPFGGDAPTAFRRDVNRLEWRPFADTRQILGNREDPISQKKEYVYAENSERGFNEGTARTVVFQLVLGNERAPARYLASPEHCLLAAELHVPLEAAREDALRGSGFEAVPRLSQVARKVYLRNEMQEGFCSGGVFRYLDQFPEGRWEFSCDGNETASYFRGSYLYQDLELFRLAIRNADYGADLGCNHASFYWHYHEAQPDQRTYSLIYMRFGGLVHAHMETGDPYYLEIAEAVAHRWMATHRTHWPRRGIGRDAEPVEGLLILHDFTGHNYYFDAARQIARDVAGSVDSEGLFRSGAGCGPFWGVNALPGSPWMGAHLLSGLADFLMRSDAEEPLREEALSGARRLLRSILKMLAETDYFHRTTGAFAWRRHYSVAKQLDDKALQEEVGKVLRATLARFEEEGERFFAMGHHCAGYIDNPLFFLHQSAKEQLPQ